MKKFHSAGLLLEIANTLPCRAAVVGCGGKTAFIEALVSECRDAKVLITPTTKIWPMRSDDVILKTKLGDCLAHRPKNGIQCLGVLNDTTGKLEALPPDCLDGIVSQYDVTLLEADGSGGMPCKGWLPSEPVVPRYCTHTIGIATLSALGKPADENTVHRLAEFLTLTGLCRGDTITLRALTDMVCAEGGMFRQSVGRLCIFINQVEDDTTAAGAEDLLMTIREENPGRFATLAYGSAQANRWTRI